MTAADDERVPPRGSVFGLDRITAVPSTDTSERSEEIWGGLRKGASAETLALLDELKNPPSRSWLNRLGVLVISLLLFVSLGLLQWSVAEIAVLVVVILVHETGHYLAMLVFGYRDVRMFFIPLFGAAVSGSGTDAPGCQRTLVALAGPVPGILVGIVLAVGFQLTGQTLVGDAAKMFIALNAFNLLPLLPLDGGHVLQETLFCRSRRLEATFQVAAAVGMLLLGIAGRSLVFGVLGVMLLSSVRFTLKVNGIAARLRESGKAPDLRTPSEATVEFVVGISNEVKTAFPGGLKPAQMVSLIRTVIEKLHTKPPTAWPTVLLLGAYGTAIVLAFIGTVLIVASVGPQLSARCAEGLAALAKSGGVEATSRGNTVTFTTTTIAVRARVENGASAQGNSLVGITVASAIGSAPPLTAQSAGIGFDETEALEAAVQEWLQLAGVALVRAAVLRERSPEVFKVGDFSAYPGSTGIPGSQELTWSRTEHEKLLGFIRPAIAGLDTKVFHSVSLAIAVDSTGASRGECRVDGVISQPVLSAAQRFPWPRPSATYTFKQYYVLSAAK